MTRHHAMLFPAGPQMPDIEALRRQWDPAMAQAIAPHITLVYPDEHPGLDSLRQRVRAVAEHTPSFVISLGDYRAFPPPDDQCVYIEVRDTDGGYAKLRKAITAPPFQPLDFPPHLTLIHPRTSQAAADFWRAGLAQPVRTPIFVDAVVITSFEDGVYAVEERFPLR